MTLQKIITYLRKWDEENATHVQTIIGTVVMVLLSTMFFIEMCFLFYIFH